jgi:beta-lactamase superfamily II metal-dependent hydrolase
MSVDFHFLNVGNGDCTVIDFPARTNGVGQNQDARVMMVDIHHHGDHEEYEHVIDYYKKHFRNGAGLRPIFRYVSSHPHKDHMMGLKALFFEVKVCNFWDIDHEFAPAQDAPDWQEYKDDWFFYEKLRDGTNGVTVLRYTDASRPVQYWDEDRITVLSPSGELYKFVHEREDGTRRTKDEIGAQLNNLSYVLLIQVNGLKVLLTGDAEQKCWDYILANHAEDIKNIDILKAPHHGRESAFHEEAVRLMKPKHIVLSAAADCEHAVPEKYKKAAPGAAIHDTSKRGSFILKCGFDGSISLG